jgi:hypothetical protein
MAAYTSTPVLPATGGQVNFNPCIFVAKGMDTYGMVKVSD